MMEIDDQINGKLNIKKFTRKADVIKKALVKKDRTLVNKENLVVYFPKRFEDKDICFFNDYTSVIGYLAIVNEKNEYSVMNMPSFINLNPSKISKVKYNDVEYYKLEFEANNIFCTNVNIVKADSHIYNAFEEFFIRGNIPWYFNYFDTSRVFDLAGKYCNSGIGNDPIALELFTSILARSPETKEVYYRNYINNNKGKLGTDIEYIGLLNVFYTFSNNLSKITGAYLKDGITSAINNQDANEVSEIEKILRS